MIYREVKIYIYIFWPVNIFVKFVSVWIISAQRRNDLIQRQPNYFKLGFTLSKAEQPLKGM